MFIIHQKKYWFANQQVYFLPPAFHTYVRMRTHTHTQACTHAQTCLHTHTHIHEDANNGALHMVCIFTEGDWVSMGLPDLLTCWFLKSRNVYIKLTHIYFQNWVIQTSCIHFLLNDTIFILASDSIFIQFLFNIMPILIIFY